MPCNGDHLEATEWERESREVAQHLVWLLPRCKKKVGKKIRRAAEAYYGNPKKVHKWTAKLCKLCRENNSVLYHTDSIRDPDARKLVEWWEAHLKADKKKRKKHATATRQNY